MPTGLMGPSDPVLDPIPPNQGVGLFSEATQSPYSGVQDTVPTQYGGSFKGVLDDPTLAGLGGLPPVKMNVGSQTRPGGQGSAFEWTCSEWELLHLPPLYMLVNPSSIRWSIPFRMTRTNVFGGTIFHKWKSPGGSSADLPTLQFTFNTGLLYSTNALIGQTAKGSKIYQQSSTDKIKAFYSFCQLSQISAFTSSGQPNLISIRYKTLVFPDATLFVHFTDPIQFSEDATKPFNIEYTCSVVVLKMVPAFGSTDLAPFLLNTHVGNGVTEPLRAQAILPAGMVAGPR